MIMSLEMTFSTMKSPAQAVEALKRELARQNFSILFQLHLNEKLAEKGIELSHDVHILEVCNAAKAKEAIEMDVRVANFLPCKLVVAQADGKTSLSLVKPTEQVNSLGNERLQPLAREIEQALVDVLKMAQ